MDCILCDYPAAGRLAAEHLIQLGHRNIAHICGPAAEVVTAEEVTSAFVDRLSELGIDIPDRQIVSADFQIEAGARAADELLSRCPGLTAIFCGSDKMAIGASQTAKARGLIIGEDLAIVGCDGLPAASVADPPLTTIRLNYYDLGYAACRRLLRRIGNIAGSREDGITPRIAVQLVQRKSSGPAPSPASPTA